jgi:ATP-dependent Clp protease ATP-binding subunit ClpC
MSNFDLDEMTQLAIRAGVTELTLGRSQNIVVDHVLYGAILTYDRFSRSLQDAGVNVRALKANTARQFPKLSIMTPNPVFEERLLRGIQHVAKQNNGVVSLTMLLLWILRNRPQSLILNDIENQSVSIDAVATYLDSASSESSEEEALTIPDELAPFTVDMTAQAQSGMYDRAIGRDPEIQEILVTLAQRRSPNPILIGEAGVGKTAIVEEIACRIIEGSLPSLSGNTRLVSVNLGGAVAGTMWRGEFERRMQAWIQYAEANPNVIFFVDEAHILVGAGNMTHGADAANMLKTALDRGRMRVIFATTPTEYQATIERDPALSRRLVPIFVDEPSPHVLNEILSAQAQDLGRHHRVTISNEAVAAALRVSRFITGRNPAAACKILDRAAAYASLTAQQGTNQDRVQSLNDAFERALSDGDIAQALEIQNELTRILGSEASAAPVTITARHIVDEVARLTGIAPELIDGRTSDVVQNVRKVLHESIIGQDPAIDAIANALNRRILGVSTDERPIGSFLFVGPSGVGKTETARMLAHALFGDPDAVIHIDMASLKYGHAVSSITGAPPGYVGYDDPTPLDTVRRKPYQVILLDEIEKADPSVVQMFLQALDQGRIQMNNGRVVDLRNCIIIMTSNAGSDYKRTSPLGLARGSHHDDAVIPEALQETFRPEFLGRIDAIVPFQPLTYEHLKDIAQKMTHRIARRIAERRGIEIEAALDDAAASLLARIAETPAFGARTLRRIIESGVGPVLYEAVNNADAHRCTVTIELHDDNAYRPLVSQRGHPLNVTTIISDLQKCLTATVHHDRSVTSSPVSASPSQPPSHGRWSRR